MIARLVVLEGFRIGRAARVTYRERMIVARLPEAEQEKDRMAVKRCTGRVVFREDVTWKERLGYRESEASIGK